MHWLWHRRSQLCGIVSILVGIHFLSIDDRYHAACVCDVNLGNVYLLCLTRVPFYSSLLPGYIPPLALAARTSIHIVRMHGNGNWNHL